MWWILLVGILYEKDAWCFDLVRLAIGDDIEITGTEGVLDHILEAIERCSNEVVVTLILGVVSAITRVDSDDAGAWITLGFSTADYCFCWGDACNFSTLKDEVLIWVELWFGSLWERT